MKHFNSIIILLFYSVVFNSCSTFSYYNKKNFNPQAPCNGIATFDVKKSEDDKNLVLLALSGGGSRAAYFSAAVMFKLEELGILQKVDAISSVSGGSIAAAYYCISGDKENKGNDTVSGRVWEEKEVKKLLKRDLISRFIGNLFWPDNMFLYWLTSYNRSDIMAQTLADNYFDKKYSGIDLQFSDFNYKRPRLILNSTVSTKIKFGESFTFTDEDFKKNLNSDINNFLISHAVMASASFPGVFQYNALRDFSAEKKRYLHLYDGGVYDNLGLESLKRIIYNPNNASTFNNLIIILVDADNSASSGIASSRYSTKGYIVDSTITDSFDILLSEKRKNSIKDIGNLRNELIYKYQNTYNKKINVIFLHLKFESVRDLAQKTQDKAKKEYYINLFKKLNKIPTNLRLSETRAGRLEECTKVLFSKDIENQENISKVNEIRRLLDLK